jgi:hypothetical protein
VKNDVDGVGALALADDHLTRREVARRATLRHGDKRLRRLARHAVAGGIEAHRLDRGLALTGLTQRAGQVQRRAEWPRLRGVEGVGFVEVRGAHDP